MTYPYEFGPQHGGPATNTANRHQPPTVEDFFAQPTEPDDDEAPGQWAPQWHTPAGSGTFVGVESLTVGQNTLWQIPDDPMERVAVALERVVEVLTTPPYVVGQGQTFAAELATTGHTDALREQAVAQMVEQAQAFTEQYADLEAKAEVMAQVIADVDAALGKSKAAPALAAKAVIEAWRKGPAEPVEEPEPTGLSSESPEHHDNHRPNGADCHDGCPRPDDEPGGATTYPGDPVTVTQAEVPAPVEQPDAPSAMLVALEPPAHDASVTDWRSYARRVTGVPAGEACVFDTMNRSQVRTALGIEHNVEGGA